MKYLLFLIPFLIYAQDNPLILLMGDKVPDVYAIDLNGTDEYADISSPTGLDLSGTTYTIIAWVKTYDPIDGGSRAIISTDADPTRGWVMQLATNEAWAMVVDNGIGAASSTAAETRAGTWTLIVAQCTRAGANSDYSIYIDGTSSCTSGCSNYNNTSNGDSKLTIGMDGYPQSWFWNSQLGQIQVVTGYALTSEEITALYNAGGNLNASYGGGTVVAWYKWEGATDAEMLQDWSASGNDLTGHNLTTADQVLIGASYK